MASSEFDDETDRFDAEIASLQDEVSTLKRMLKVESSTLLASLQANHHNATSSSLPRSHDKLIEHAVKQQAHVQQSLYRMASSITAFKVQDPDPNAVDGGRVLGLRFEVMSRGQFLNPYYVMLNRPFQGSKHLRVHRHTVPPAIPIRGLAARHLPEPKKNDGSDTRQDLERFARALRREIMRYHNRLGVSADLRRATGLHDEEQLSPDDNIIVEVGLADIEAKQIELTWADSKTGRLVIDDDGKVLNFAVIGRNGRDWETMSALYEENDHIEDVVRRLEQHAGD